MLSPMRLAGCEFDGVGSWSVGVGREENTSLGSSVGVGELASEEPRSPEPEPESESESESSAVVCAGRRVDEVGVGSAVVNWRREVLVSSSDDPPPEPPPPPPPPPLLPPPPVQVRPIGQQPLGRQ